MSKIRHDSIFDKLIQNHPIIECVPSGHAGGENNLEFLSIGKKSFIFLQIAFIVLLLQHGCREHTLFRVKVMDLTC